MREKCHIYDCHNPAEDHDIYCAACGAAIDLAEREEYEAAAEEELDAQREAEHS